MTNKYTETIQMFESSGKLLIDYIKLRGFHSKDTFSYMSEEELYSMVSNEDKERLLEVIKYNPVLKLEQKSILRWRLRGLSMEDAIIRSQIQLNINTAYIYNKMKSK